MRYVDIFELNSLLEIRKNTLHNILNFSNECSLKKHQNVKSCIKRLEIDIKLLKTKIKEWNRKYNYHYNICLTFNSEVRYLNKSKDIIYFYNYTEKGKELYNKEQYEFFKKD